MLYPWLLTLCLKSLANLSGSSEKRGGARDPLEERQAAPREQGLLLLGETQLWLSDCQLHSKPGERHPAEQQLNGVGGPGEPAEGGSQLRGGAAAGRRHPEDQQLGVQRGVLWPGWVAFPPNLESEGGPRLPLPKVAKGPHWNLLTQVWHHRHRHHHRHHPHDGNDDDQEEGGGGWKPRGKPSGNSFSVAFPAHQWQSL